MKFSYRSSVFAIVILIACSGNDSNVLTGSGVLEGTEILISSEIPGRVINLPVTEGTVLNQDQLIAEIDTENLRIQTEQIEGSIRELEFNILNAKTAISQAETQYDYLYRQYERIRALYEDNSASKQQFDEAETRSQTAADNLTQAKNTLNTLLAKKQQADANLKLNRKRISDCRITSPRQGTVVDKFVEQGEVIAMGSPIVVLADLSTLWIKLYIKEDELGFVNLGARTDIRINSCPERIFPGQVVWISPKAEFTPSNVQTQEARADLVYAVKISVPNESGILKIGMPADISLKKESGDW